MRASEKLMEALAQIALSPSPWREGLLESLGHCIAAARLHEECVGPISNGTAPPKPPRTTALGHKPRGIVVTGNATHTDAALEALECAD